MKRDQHDAERTASTDGCCRGIADLLRPPFFKALGDRQRLEMLVRLATCCRPCSVTEIASCCPIDISVVSRHLSVLRDVGLVAAEKRGKEVYYGVCYSILVEELRAMADAIEACCPKEVCDDDVP